MNTGIIFAILAYFLWGILPIFWKLLKHIPAHEILLHRMVWSFIFVLTILFFRKNWFWLKKIKENPKLLLTFLLTAFFLSTNWFTYIWSMNNNYVVEASLGYFINPLISVLLGVLVLKERLRLFQWSAILIALIGVLFLTVRYGSFPWIAMILAFTFGFYGLLKKRTKLNSLEGFSLETGFMSIPALFFLSVFELKGIGSFGHGNIISTFLLFCAGIVTALPLILFAAAARRITLTNLGILQYIAPTLQFLIGIFIYQEAFPTERLIGFCIIWFALVVYSIEGIVFRLTFNTTKI